MLEHYQKASAAVQGSILYVVATPIGNLADMTLRALAVLSCAEWVCAEDTRVTAQLLRAYGIRAGLMSVREHNEQQMVERVLAALAAGQVVAQVSDAGTPAVCDPGARLVAAVRAAGYAVVPVVGASAVMAALSVAGVVEPSFYFHGFLPAKQAERVRVLTAWQDVVYPVVMFETPHRICAALADMAAVLPERRVMLGREITKVFETFLTGTPDQLQAVLASDGNQSRGEMVLVLHPAAVPEKRDLSPEAARVVEILAAQLPTKQAAELAAQLTGLSKRVLYEAALVCQGRTAEGGK